MFRFSIREWALVVIIVGLTTGWIVEHRRNHDLSSENHALQIAQEMMAGAIEIMEQRENALAQNLPRLEPVYAEQTQAAKTKATEPDAESTCPHPVATNDQ